uniref:Centrosomal protein of 162 kDa n=1 Tax=Maylandia zebra TaxID=106582 RepID=A0A3P9AVW7_9CICH
MEQILRSRNPNSLPALIYAAATSASHEDRRIQRLEAELENHDEEAKRSLQVMEQQFHRVKVQLTSQQLEAAAGSQSPVVQALEEELYRVKQSHKQKEKSLHEQIESLQQQLKQKVKPFVLQALLSPGRHQRQAEAAFGVRLERLNQELAKKTRTIQELKKERRNMPSAPNTRAERRSTESKHQQPGTRRFFSCFLLTGSHISEVLQENEALKKQVELVLLQSEQEKEALKADAAQFEEQLSTTKAEHFRVLDHLRATHALEHSDSKVAELTNKLSTQEVGLPHQAASVQHEPAVRSCLTKLLQELKEAKEASSSEVKLLCTLERKILNMELRHQHREKELQQVPVRAQLSELEHWRRLAQDKSREMDAFRLELDAILDILRHLQRQGAVLPTPELAIPQRS